MITSGSALDVSTITIPLRLGKVIFTIVSVITRLNFVFCDTVCPFSCEGHPPGGQTPLYSIVARHCAIANFKYSDKKLVVNRGKLVLVFPKMAVIMRENQPTEDEMIDAEELAELSDKEFSNLARLKVHEINIIFKEAHNRGLVVEPHVYFNSSEIPKNHLEIKLSREL
jgi:hypothetical protein